MRNNWTVHFTTYYIAAEFAQFECVRQSNLGTLAESCEISDSSANSLAFGLDALNGRTIRYSKGQFQGPRAAGGLAR